MKTPTLEAHEQWLIDLEGRIEYLENSQPSSRLDEKATDLAHETMREKNAQEPEREWAKKQWDFVLQLKARILHLEKTFQEHYQYHSGIKKGGKKKDFTKYG